MSKSERKYWAYTTLNEIKKKGFLVVERPQQVAEDIKRFYKVDFAINKNKISLIN